MHRPRRTTNAVARLALVAALALGISSCGGSSDDGGAKATTTSTTTTAAAPAEGSTTTTAGDDDTGATTTTSATGDSGAGSWESCEELLRIYTEEFSPDDLPAIARRLREWSVDMPDDVAAAANRIADAYDEAQTLADVDIADQDLTADAQTFSDWTSQGCPRG